MLTAAGSFREHRRNFLQDLDLELLIREGVSPVLVSVSSNRTVLPWRQWLYLLPRHSRHEMKVPGKLAPRASDSGHSAVVAVDLVSVAPVSAPYFSGEQEATNGENGESGTRCLAHVKDAIY